MISTLLASVCFVSAFSAVRGDYSDGSYCSLLYRNNCKPSCSSGEQERRSVYQLCYIGKCCQPADSGSGSGSATWSNWSSWSACSATCGSGYQTRSRTCAGSNCPTASERASQSCTRPPCRAAVTPRVCGRDVLNARILGGRPTIECAHPWMVNFALYSIQQATPGVTGSLCGGVLISNNAVLTQTACVDKYFRPAWKLPSPGINIVVVVGDHKTGATDPNQRNRIVTEDLITGLGELTIVRLDPPVRYNSCVVPVCLPEATSSLSQQCTVAGWGETGSSTGWSDVLRDHPATLMSKESCETIFRYNYNENLPDGFLCTDSQRDKTSTCLGDEGGMLLCGDSTFGRTTLAGIANSTECDVNKPSTFMNIAPYMDKLVDYLDKN